MINFEVIWCDVHFEYFGVWCDVHIEVYFGFLTYSNSYRTIVEKSARI